jgi:hypothetical protein
LPVVPTLLIVAAFPFFVAPLFASRSFRTPVALVHRLRCDVIFLFHDEGRRSIINLRLRHSNFNVVNYGSTALDVLVINTTLAAVKPIPRERACYRADCRCGISAIPTADPAAKQAAGDAANERGAVIISPSLGGNLFVPTFLTRLVDNMVLGGKCRERKRSKCYDCQAYF